MNRIHKVLVATDFSSDARHAADRAALLCKETGAALELFHAVNVSGLDRLRRLVPGIPNGLEQRAMEERREEISQLGQSLGISTGSRPMSVWASARPFRRLSSAPLTCLRTWL